MKRKHSVGVWSVCAKVCLLVFLGAAAFDAHSRAVADGSPAVLQPQEEPPEPPGDEHIPNTPYPDGPDSIALGDMSPEDQAGTEAIGQRSKLATEVHAAWSSAVHSLAVEGAAQRAAHQSGTTGVDSIEVAP